MTALQRIADAFAVTTGRVALMPYLMGGYPTIEDSLRIGHACVEAGADLLEVGVPYSDPLADGPVIHQAGAVALANGADLRGVLGVIEQLSARVPVVMMCYVNMVLAAGMEAFIERLALSGACGLVVPDLPLEESDGALAACDDLGLALVPLVAPTTPGPRLARIGARARGFLYTVAVVGTTGERGSHGPRFEEVVAAARSATAVPVALGFGISTPDQALRAARAGADGVIVGTRLVRAAGESEDPASAVGEVVGELAASLRSTG